MTSPRTKREVCLHCSFGCLRKVKKHNVFKGESINYVTCIQYSLMNWQSKSSRMSTTPFGFEYHTWHLIVTWPNVSLCLWPTITVRVKNPSQLLHLSKSRANLIELWSSNCKEILECRKLLQIPFHVFGLKIPKWSNQHVNEHPFSYCEYINSHNYWVIVHKKREKTCELQTHIRFRGSTEIQKKTNFVFTQSRRCLIISLCVWFADESLITKNAPVIALVRDNEKINNSLCLSFTCQVFQTLWASSTDSERRHERHNVSHDTSMCEGSEEQQHHAGPRACLLR